MKILIGSLLFMISLHGISQSSSTFYFDEYMHPTSKKKAVISGKGEMDSGFYKLTCYYKKKKNQIACEAYFKDSTRQISEGRYKAYFEDGTTKTTGNYLNGKKEGLWINYDNKGKENEESIYKDGMPVTCKRFYEISDNNQRLITVDDVANNSFNITLYSLQGQVISDEKIPQDYTEIYLGDDTLCSFPGGAIAWQRYISKEITHHISDFNDADYGTAFLRFIIDTSGNVTDVLPLNMQSSTLTKIVFNAIDGGPKWVPGQHNGKKVKMIRIQPVTLRNPK